MVRQKTLDKYIGHRWQHLLNMIIQIEKLTITLRDLKEVESKLEPARGVLMGGAHVLKALQAMLKRNLTQEERVGLAVNDIILHEISLRSE